MSRDELFKLILEVFEIDDSEQDVNEETSLDTLEFNSLSKLGVISVMDAYANIVISTKDLRGCKTLGEILDLANA